MARDQMHRVPNARYPAPRFNLAHAILKEAMPPSCPDFSHPVGLWQGFIGGDLPL
jgi:hypothetical protein